MGNEQPTLLDQFAMAALTGLLANPNTSLNYAALAQVAYNIAFNMKIERSKQ